MRGFCHILLVPSRSVIPVNSRGVPNGLHHGINTFAAVLIRMIRNIIKPDAAPFLGKEVNEPSGPWRDDRGAVLIGDLIGNSAGFKPRGHEKRVRGSIKTAGQLTIKTYDHRQNIRIGLREPY